MLCSPAVILYVTVEGSIQTKERNENIDATVCFNCGTSGCLKRNTKGDVNRRSCRPQIINMQLDTQPAMKSAAVAMLMTPLPNEEFSFVSNWIDS